MPREFIALMLACAPLFSKLVFQHVQVPLVGAILTPSKRIVTQALRLIGKRQDPHLGLARGAREPAPEEGERKELPISLAQDQTWSSRAHALTV